MSNKSIYTLATNTKKPISSLIRMYTGEDYNHASIGFDKTLVEFYSFSMGNDGFVRENIKVWPVWTEFELHEIRVTDAQYNAAKKFVLEESKRGRKFSYAGIAGIILNRPLQSEEAMFCSEFVERACLAAGLPPSASSPALTTPTGVVRRKGSRKIASGNLHQYIIGNFSKRGQRLIAESISDEQDEANMGIF